MLGAFSIAQVIFAPFSSFIKNAIGIKNTILFGFFMLTITTIGLGVIANIHDAITFKYTGDALRFFQGFGDILLQVTCYNLVCNIYSDEILKYIGYIEIAVGLGLGLGPFLGSAVFSRLDYAGTMYFFGGVNVVGLVMCIIAIPSELNETVSVDEEINHDLKEDFH